MGESLWKNEETGENRVKFFITLVTAVLAALVALAKAKNGLDDGILAQVSIYAIFALLFFGIVTLYRMMIRNAMSDIFKYSMCEIRQRF